MNIDDILFPAESQRRELDRRIAMIDHALEILSEARRPRLGANAITVNSRRVDVWVEEISGHYIASEIDYDEGRPLGSGITIACALHDLTQLLTDEEDNS